MPYTDKEAGALLRTRLKPYLHINPPMPQSDYSKKLVALEDSRLKRKTAKEFLERFGFAGEPNIWQLDKENWKLEPR